VLVDKSTVPIALGDLLVTVAASVEVPARVVFVHPTSNFALVRFDPNRLGGTVCASAEMDPTPLRVSEWARRTLLRVGERGPRRSRLPPPLPLAVEWLNLLRRSLRQSEWQSEWRLEWRLGAHTAQ
jgi:hypothetical protein